MIELTAEQITEAIREYVDRRYGKVRAVTLSGEVSAIVSVIDPSPEGRGLSLAQPPTH